MRGELDLDWYAYTGKYLVGGKPTSPSHLCNHPRPYSHPRFWYPQTLTPSKQTQQKIMRYLSPLLSYPRAQLHSRHWQLCLYSANNSILWPSRLQNRQPRNRNNLSPIHRNPWSDSTWDRSCSYRGLWNTRQNRDSRIDSNLRRIIRSSLSSSNRIICIDTFFGWDCEWLWIYYFFWWICCYEVEGVGLRILDLLILPPKYIWTNIDLCLFPLKIFHISIQT